MSKKIGLAVIYDPHNVYQFLWYYCTYGKDIEWYALCLPNSNKGEYLSVTCEKLGIFNKVYRDTKPFDAMPLMDRLFLFIKMFFYAVFGQQKRFCKKLIASYIDKLNFDTAVVLTDVGFISGLFLTLGKEKQVVILEDGMGDYMERKYSNIFSHFHNFFDVQGFFLSLLGYSNIGHCFPLRTTKYCEKYCSHPDKMKYKNYKELKTLFETENTDNELFRKLLNIIYPNLSSIFNQKYDAILFTTPLTDYVHNDGKYVNKIVTYINNNFNSVLLKKHPRDSVNYHFNENIQSVEIDQTIPAEVLLPYLDGIKLFFCEHSSTNLYLLSFHYSPQYFYFTDLKNDNLKEKNILCQYKDENSFREGLAFFELPLNIIKL